MDISMEDGALVLSGRAGQRLIRHPLWVRERLPDPRVVDPVTGQRLLEAAELPLDLKITHVAAVNDEVNIGFSDGFETKISRRWFDDDDEMGVTGDLAEDITLWDAGLATLPVGVFATMAHSEPALAAFLNAVHAHGFAIVRGVPVQMNGALDFAGFIGPIRSTNWGGVADVKAISHAYDLTMTPRHLEPHSDNPYRDPVPGYILLHCLLNDADGGESSLVDGFRAAMLLKQTDPAAFAALTRTRVQFRYADSDTLLENSGTLIELDDGGRIVQVRYSNRTERVAAYSLTELDEFYRARRALYGLIHSDPALTLNFKLMPGDLLMMDNFRIFHGRRAYRLETGSRHMRQCYMDRDIVQSRRRVLNRRLSPKVES